VQGVWISSFSTTVKGITHSVESHCPPCEDAQCVGDTWSVECQGHTTHQSVSTSTTTNYFSTANCSAESPPNG
jgi:hypothetical protein